MHYLLPTCSAHEQIEQPDCENCHYPRLVITGHWSSRDFHFPHLKHKSSEPLQLVTLCCLGGCEPTDERLEPTGESQPSKRSVHFNFVKAKTKPTGKKQGNRNQRQNKSPKKKTEAQPRGLEQNKPYLCQNASFQMYCQFFFLCSHT